MVDTLIPKDRNQEELQEIADNRELEKNKYPNFFDTAERINLEQQEYLVETRRAFNLKPKKGETHDLVNGLVTAIGEELTVYEMIDDNKKLVHLPMLKMRVEKNDAAVYVPVQYLGANYRHAISYIGQSKKIVMRDFVDTKETDETGNALYVAYGSILDVENAMGELIMEQFESNPEAAKNQDRVGVITEVVASDTTNMIFFDYQGVSLTMLERDFHYRSYLHPLGEDARVGKKIKFRITDIREDTFEDMKSVKEDQQNGKFTPEGKRFYIRTTRLPFLPNPDSKVIDLANNHTAFLATIVNWHPIKGVIVEIAPGWWVKGYLPANSNIKFSMNDVYQHTKVVVVINFINPKDRTGQVYINGTPNGVAPKISDADFDNRALAKQLAEEGGYEIAPASQSQSTVEEPVQETQADDAETMVTGEPLKVEPEVENVKPYVQPEEQLPSNTPDK